MLIKKIKVLRNQTRETNTKKKEIMSRAMSSVASGANNGPGPTGTDWSGWFSRFATPWKTYPAMTYSLLVIGVVLLLALLSKWSENDRKYSSQVLQRIKSMIEHAARWNAMAQQDSNPVMQLIHCNYALAYAQATRVIASDRDIENITGIDVHELMEYLQQCQAFTVNNINQQCPQVKIDGVYSVGAGWST